MRGAVVGARALAAGVRSGGRVSLVGAGVLAAAGAEAAVGVGRVRLGGLRRGSGRVTGVCRVARVHMAAIETISLELVLLILIYPFRDLDLL